MSESEKFEFIDVFIRIKPGSEIHSILAWGMDEKSIWTYDIDINSPESMNHKGNYHDPMFDKIFINGLEYATDAMIEEIKHVIDSRPDISSIGILTVS